MAARAERTQLTHEDLFEGLPARRRRPAQGIGDAGRPASARPSPTTRPGTSCAPSCAPTVDKTLHATINPRGEAAGFAIVGRTDRALHTAQHIHEQLIYILGGRAAEHVIYGTVSSGAANDLEKANGIARAAVEQYGLSAAVGQVVATRAGSPSSRRRPPTARCAGSSRRPTATRSPWSRSTASSSSA